MREKRACVKRDILRTGITPAYAGKTNRGRNVGMPEQGSPPRMREKLDFIIHPWRM